jgi:hypothetical protein
MRQLLIPVKEELYAAQTRLLWLELKPPFYGLRWLLGRLEGGS